MGHPVHGWKAESLTSLSNGMMLYVVVVACYGLKFSLLNREKVSHSCLCTLWYKFQQYSGSNTELLGKRSPEYFFNNELLGKRVLPEYFFRSNNELLGKRSLSENIYRFSNNELLGKRSELLGKRHTRRMPIPTDYWISPRGFDEGRRISQERMMYVPKRGSELLGK